jgi:hypothetical protein
MNLQSKEQSKTEFISEEKLDLAVMLQLNLNSHLQPYLNNPTIKSKTNFFNQATPKAANRLQVVKTQFPSTKEIRGMHAF